MNQYDEAEKVPHFHFVASQPDPTPQDVAAPTLERARERMRQAWDAWEVCRAEVDSLVAEIDRVTNKP